jgi:hypothetical protein
MKNFIRIFFGLLGCGLLALALMPSTERQAQASNPTNPSAVFVTNTPLPVQGSVSLDNTPNVNIANTPSMNVANNPTVTLGNTSVPIGNALDSGGNPVPLLVSSAVEPYESSCKLGNPFFGEAFCQFDAIPAGKRLVIREFDISTQSQSGSLTDVELLVPWKSQLVNHYFPALTNGTDGSGALHEALHQETTIYADTSRTDGPRCFTAETTGTYTGACAISGYLIPAQ